MRKQSRSARRNSNQRRQSRRNRRQSINRNNTMGSGASVVPEIDIRDGSNPENSAREALKFQCQLAHGSPTGLVSEFISLPQLYEAIANCYEGVDADDILYCTANTHKVDMDHLISTTLDANDYIFAHVTGVTKQITLTKTENALGLTISDNGAGKAFVKRIKPNSICCKSSPTVQVGAFIEQIDGMNMKGKRHFDVAYALRQIVVGQTFTMRITESVKSAIDFVNGNAKKTMKHEVTSGLKTLRLKADGKEIIQESPSCPLTKSINDIFDSYLGFHDDELAEAAWNIALKCSRVTDMEARFKESEIAEFDFPVELVFDIWGVVDDWKKRRSNEISEQNREHCTP